MKSLAFPEIKNVFDLNLTFPFSWCWFIDWHFDGLFKVGDHNGAKGRELCTTLFVIHRPKAMEHQISFIPETKTRTYELLTKKNQNYSEHRI